MARIVVATDAGDVIEVLSDLENEIGNLDKPIARAHLIEQIVRALKQAREAEEG